jgi:hypothetical protein
MAMACDGCRKVPPIAKAEGNLYPWIKLEFPINSLVKQPAMAEGHRAGFARITDDRVFCDVPCLRTWLLVQEEFIERGQYRTMEQFMRHGGTVDDAP